MNPEKLFDLLEHWHDLRRQGRRIGIEELCQECPELAGKVARLVRAVEATDWLEERTADVVAVSRSPTSPEELGLPGKVGRYELRELIGEGGFGYVFRGYDPELRRQVAVKVARPSRTTSQERAERFLEEARRAAQLKHPGIVPVYDVGRDGRWIYIVSDLVEGCDLGTAARHRRLPAAESARIVAEVADALQCAHRTGLLHRDVKPANILLDRAGHVFLTDFGIAATQEQLQEGAVPSEGTLAYMAPEQLAATDGRAGPQSDVYSLGVVLYELLTDRRPPRRADSPICLQEPARLEDPCGGKSSGVPRPATLGPSVPAGLDAVCRRALAESPTERFSSAAEFAHAVRGAVTKKGRRLMPWLAALAGMVLVLGTALIVAQRVWQRQPPPLLAEEQRLTASGAETIGRPPGEPAAKIAGDNPPKPAADGQKHDTGESELAGPPIAPRIGPPWRVDPRARGGPPWAHVGPPWRAGPPVGAGPAQSQIDESGHGTTSWSWTSSVTWGQSKAAGSGHGPPPTRDVVNKAPQSPQDFAAVVSDLDSGDRGRRIRATMRLLRGKPKEPNPAVAKALERVLKEDGDAPIRVNAARGLANWGTAASIPALQEAAEKDSDAIVRSRAGKAIEAIKRRQ